MPLILPGNVGSATAAAGFSVDNSCRFNPADSAFMHKTPNAGNRKKATFSCWFKRSLITSAQTLFWAGSDNSNYQTFPRFLANDKIVVAEINSGSTTWEIFTNRQFRDVGAWYHIVVALDTTQSTAANRVKIYVNGVQETDVNTDGGYPGANRDTLINTAVPHQIAHDYVAQYYGGYVAEACFLEGSQNAPTDFGEFDEDSGIWKPIDVSGLTFGTNGFYLDYEASGNLGNDVNGGTDLTESGLAATDQSLDTCTNNFNTYSTLWGMQAIRVPTFAEGNLKITGDGDAQHHQVMGTFAVNKGKWYWEAKFTVSADIGKNKVGIMSVDLGSPQTAEIVDQSGSCVFVNEDGGDFRRDNATVDQNSGVFTQNQIIGVALNMDDGEISIYRDNSLIVDALDIGNADGTYVTPASVHYRDAGMEFNFGSAPYALTSSAADGDGFGAFEFAPPSGYFALCSKNLAEYG